jgi:hypothetical protein
MADGGWPLSAFGSAAYGEQVQRLIEAATL